MLKINSTQVAGHPYQNVMLIFALERNIALTEAVFY
jgi:hypothetical protein